MNCTGIRWTDGTWNLARGCRQVSLGCLNYQPIQANGRPLLANDRRTLAELTISNQIFLVCRNCTDVDVPEGTP